MKRAPVRVTATMPILRDAADVRLDIAGDYYPCEPADTGPGDPYPGCSGDVNLLSVELNARPFWGDLTDEERARAEDVLRAVGDGS